MAERQVPGGPFVNESGTAQRQVPGGPFVNETVSTGGAVPNITALSAENILATSADYRVTLDYA